MQFGRPKLFFFSKTEFKEIVIIQKDLKLIEYKTCLSLSCTIDLKYPDTRITVQFSERVTRMILR